MVLAASKVLFLHETPCTVIESDLLLGQKCVNNLTKSLLQEVLSSCDNICVCSASANFIICTPTYLQLHNAMLKHDDAAKTPFFK